MNLARTILLLCIIPLAMQAAAQKKNEFGIVIHSEKTVYHSEEVSPGATKATYTHWNFGLGGVYGRIFNKHSSASFALKYRKVFNDVYVPFPIGINFTDYAHFLVAENFLTLPIQYKYNFGLFNLSVGTSIDYFLSWKDQRVYYYAPLQSYDNFFNDKWSFGLLGSISKKLQIDKNLLLEPAIYYNPMLSFRRTYFGASLEVKYKL